MSYLFPISVLRYNALDRYDITTEEMLTQWARRRNDPAEECHGTQACQGKDEDAEPHSERPTSLDIHMLETEHSLNEFKVQLVTTRNIASAGPSQAELDEYADQQRTDALAMPTEGHPSSV